MAEWLILFQKSLKETEILPLMISKTSVVAMSQEKLDISGLKAFTWPLQSLTRISLSLWPLDGDIIHIPSRPQIDLMQFML